MAKTVEIEVVLDPSTLQTASCRASANRQVTYKRFSKDPLCNRRAATDPIFNFLFVIILVTWLGVCLCARYKTVSVWKSSHGIHNEVYHEAVKPFDNLIDSIQEFHYKGGLFFVFASLLSTGLLIVGSLKMLCKYPKLFSNLGYNFLHFTMFFSISIMIVVTIAAAVENPVLILLTLPCSLVILINFSILSSIQLIGLDSIAIFIRKTCQSLLHCQFMILFGLLILLLELLVASFTLVIINSLYELIPMIVTFFGGLYVFLCVWYLNQMVVAEVLVSWHSQENERNIAKNVLWACIKVINRFHSGSAALQATYIVPLCLSVLVAAKSKIQNGSHSTLARCICRFYLIFGIADCSSIEIAANGFDCYKATNRVHNLLIKHSLLYVGVMAIVDVICFCALIFLGVVSYAICKLFFLVFYPQIFLESAKNGQIQIAITVEIALLLITAWFIMCTAARTTLFCSLESYEVEEKEKEECRVREPNCAEASAPTLATIQE